MRRLTALLAAGLLAGSIVGSASAARPAMPGLLPVTAHPHGHALVELATAWSLWAFSAADHNPLIEQRCEPSPLDPGIWFLPASMGTDTEVTCEVPPGAFLFITPGGIICTEVVGDGSTEEELRACLDFWFNLTYAEVRLDGRLATDLDDYLLVSEPVTLPADNLFGPSPGLTMMKTWDLVAAPLSRGTHSLRIYAEAPGFAAGITFTIVVS